jgi:tight adherence protein C
MNPGDALTSPPLLALGAGLAALLLCLALGMLLLQYAVRRARLRAATGSERGGRLVSRPTGKPAERWREDALRIIKASTTRMNVVRDKQVATVRQRLMRAGYRNRDAFLVYAFAKVLLPLLAGGLGGLYLFVLQPPDLPTLLKAMLLLGICLVGSVTPDLFLKNLETRRKNDVRKALPDALDLLVICAEAGLSLDTALHRVAREIRRTSAVLADELEYSCLELRFLSERRRAMENLIERVDSPAIRALVGTMIQSERYGTPLAQALRVLSNEQRGERMMRAEEKAARLPAIMTVPLILFVLPALFVVLLGPGALILMDGLLNNWKPH